MPDVVLKRVLVTGGHGFLGKRVIHFLSQHHGVEIYSPRRVEHDLVHEEQVEKLLTKFRNVDAIIHLAAVVGGIGANMKRPGEFFHQNMAMGLNLIEAARRHGVGKFVQIGTVCSYPKNTPVPFQESEIWNGFPEETNAPYGIAKKALVTMLQAYRQQYGMKGAVVIPTNLYGPGDNFDPASSHVIPAMVRKFEEARVAGRPEVILWGTGSASREFLHVDDAARAIVLATAKIEEPEPINLGTGREIKIRDLAERVSKACGYEGRIVWDTTKPDGQPWRCLDTTRSLERLDWRAVVDFDTGLKETIEYYRRHCVQKIATQSL